MVDPKVEAEVVRQARPLDGLVAGELVVAAVLAAVAAVVVVEAAAVVVVLQLDGQLRPLPLHNQDLLRPRRLVPPLPPQQLPQPPLPLRTTMRISTISTTRSSSRSNSSSTRLRGPLGNNNSSSNNSSRRLSL